MSVMRLLKDLFFQKSSIGPMQCFENLRISRLSTSLGISEEEVRNAPQKKLLKVAIVGRPNAGKSTLINGLLNLNVCGVSHKTHTTRSPFTAALIHGETQIVFVDTPGLVTKKEYLRFKLTDEFVKWKNKVLEEADIIGIVHEVSDPRSIFKFHLNLTQNISDFPESKPLFLVLNKIDLVIDKDELSAIINSYFKPDNLERPALEKTPKIWRKFSKIFFTAALKNTGVREVGEYLLEQAKPGEWLFQPGQLFREPLDVVILNLIRAKFLDILPHEIPYQCKYEIEYLKENSLGEIFCVSLITCNTDRHLHLITSGKKGSLRSICRELEFDLYKILGKVFRIRLVVQKK